MIRRLLLLTGMLLAAFTPVALTPAAHAQTYGNSVTIDVAFPGGSVRISICCFEPGTTVTVSVDVTVTVPGSTPPSAAQLEALAASQGASAVAGADGTALLTYTVPGNVSPGPLPLTISGTPMAGSGTPALQQAVLPVQAVAPAVPQQVALPVAPAVAAPAAVAQAAPTTPAPTGAATAAAQGATAGAALPVTGNDLTQRLSLIAALLLASGTAVMFLQRRRTEDEGDQLS